MFLKTGELVRNIGKVNDFALVLCRNPPQRDVASMMSTLEILTKDGRIVRVYEMYYSRITP